MNQIGRMAGSISQFNSSAFNQKWVSIPAVLVSGATATQNSPFSSLAVVVTIASTRAYPRRDGQAELAWVAGYVVRPFTCPKPVTHPSRFSSRTCTEVSGVENIGQCGRLSQLSWLLGAL